MEPNYIPADSLLFSSIPHPNWIRNTLNSKITSSCIPNCEWPFIFLATIWSIWESRNLLIFEGIDEQTLGVARKASLLAMDWSRNLSKTSPVKGRTPGDLSKKPNSGWFKLNTDGSYLSTSNNAAAGGLVRNDVGVFCFGFSINLGSNSIVMAELLRLREGLKLAWERRIPKLEIETDSEQIVQLIKTADSMVHPLGIFIQECRDFLRKPWEVQFRHIKREGNTCADIMAKKGHNFGADNKIWELVPDFMEAALLEDST